MASAPSRLGTEYRLPIPVFRSGLAGSLEGSMAGAIGHGKLHIQYAGSVPELALRAWWILWVLVPSAALLKS